MTGTNCCIVKSVALTVGLGLGLLAAPVQTPAKVGEDTVSAVARADSFEFSTRSYINYVPVFLSNGFLSAATTWNGAGPAAAILPGLYDQLQENSYPYQAWIPSCGNLPAAPCFTPLDFVTLPTPTRT